MIIKKFQGKTEAEAVESAKKELGTNVVVMNVRNVKRKGFFSFLSAQLVEVTVALEEESEKYSGMPKAASLPPSSGQPGNIQAGNTNLGSITAGNILVGNIPSLEPAKKTIAGFDIIDDSNDELKIDNSAIEEKLDSLHSLLEQQLQKPDEEKAPEEEKPSELFLFMRLLYNTMLDNEVDEKYANQIIDEIEKINKPNMPFDFALSNTYQKMILKFGKAEVISPAEKGPKAVFFIGPTGVGKTTTIAKIASKFSVETGSKVALLTTDTYRIAAAEQLRTYANILEVPFRVIYTKEEVEQAVAEFKGYDYILIDTAGYSHQNETQKDNMNTFLHSIDGMVEKEVFLVLSATTKYRDLLSIADAYREITKFRIIFTKLDETTTLGNLLNLKLYTGAPLSYVTYGQNVPDDIEDFNPQKIVKQLLGGRK